ncbi:unnamed protein product [Spirodela intermedia]|uniref:Uncharacterized protein n=1 Tax=Spirodela intermedia TaxID=51605 RepID=A0A7I8JE22_SPIIN|nr:unnamed protein product [Spirodela intermedia]CAA6668367.1 unnamed protein product [Spirodela intermedia]
MNCLGAEDTRGLCEAHPREAVVGVCALCLRERLLLLRASRQRRLQSPAAAAPSAAFLHPPSTRPLFAGPKLFSLGPLCRNPGDVSDGNSLVCLDDSFISIKFEKDGRATWAADPKPVSAAAAEEHARPRDALRRIGRLLQFSRWRQASKATCPGPPPPPRAVKLAEGSGGAADDLQRAHQLSRAAFF